MSPLLERSRSIALTFIRSHVTTARILFVWTRHAALVGLEKMPTHIHATVRITGIDGWASRK